MSEAEAKPRRKAGRILVGVGVLVLMGLAVLAYWFFVLRGVVYSDDARLAGHLVDLAPEVTGRLAAVHVHEGERVARGQVLFELGDEAFRASLSQAEAAARAADAALAQAKAANDRAIHGPRTEEIKAAQAAADRLNIEQKLAQTQHERMEGLFKAGNATSDELDQARATWQASQQAYEQAAQQLALLKAGTRAEDLQAAAAAVRAAEGKLAEANAAAEVARVNLARCRVAAPFDGWVVRRWQDPGAMLPVSQPVLSLFDPTTLRVDANIDEKSLHEVAVDDDVDITVDAFPSLRLTGRVTRILRAVNSDFSLIPSEGVSGTYIKVAQRVPLRIELDPPADLPLGPGLSVEVRIHIGSAARRAAEAGDSPAGAEAEAASRPAGGGR